LAAATWRGHGFRRPVDQRRLRRAYGDRDRDPRTAAGRTERSPDRSDRAEPRRTARACACGPQSRPGRGPRDARLARARPPPGGPLGFGGGAVAGASGRPRHPRHLLQRVRGRRLLRRLPPAPRRAAAAGHTGTCDLLAQRRHRVVAVVPGPVCRAGRSRLEPQRNVGPSRCLPAARQVPRRGDVPMEWMSPMDASFLHIEGPNNPMHIGGVSIFEGPAPPFEDLEEMVAGKLDAVPRYRQKVRFVPLSIARPVWVEDPHFNLSYHLRHSALPSPGSEDILRRTAARIFAQRLDRRNPLWQISIVAGLSDDRWALLSKVHHCMVDGVSATDLMTVMFDDTPPPSSAEPWEPGPEPHTAELVLRSVSHQVSNPSEQLRVVRSMTRRPRSTIAQARD